MATNIYNKQSTFNIDSLNVEDFIIKFNTITYLTLEVIFNCDIQQIINKYVVNISLVNPNNTSIVYAQFTPSSSDFGITKNTIPVSGTTTSYTQQLGYFTLRYINKNHLHLNNSSLIANAPSDGFPMQLMITINGINRLFGTRTFSTFDASPMPILPNSFSYLQNYNLATKGYYYENTDKAVIKINNQTSVIMDINTINNLSTSVNVPLRTNNTDFVYTSTAIASFSGSNSYALNKTYTISSPSTISTLWIRKSGVDRKINDLAHLTNYITSLSVGCTKLFDTTLKNASGVSDTVYLEMPLFSGLSASGLSITNISITSPSNKVNLSTTPIFTSLGLGKFKIDLSYLPTGEPASTTATYSASVIINLTHPLVGSISITASGFTYTNSTG